MGRIIHEPNCLVRVVRGARYPWNELSSGDLFLRTNSPWGDLSMRRVVLCGELSLERVVSWRVVSRGKLSMGQVVHGTNCS